MKFYSLDNPLLMGDPDDSFYLIRQPLFRLSILTTYYSLRVILDIHLPLKYRSQRILSVINESKPRKYLISAED